MNEFLQKLKLIDYQTIELDISKREFVSKLSSIVDEAELGFLSDSFDAFVSTNNIYKGKVDYQGFKIKRRKRFFDLKTSFAIAKGKFYEKESNLRIETEILGFHGYMIVFFLFLIVFYLIFFLFFFIETYNGSDDAIWFSSFILVHALFMFGIPYLFLRKSVKNLKYDLEREFYFLVK